MEYTRVVFSRLGLLAGSYHTLAINVPNTILSPAKSLDEKKKSTFIYTVSGSFIKNTFKNTYTISVDSIQLFQAW